MRLWKIHRKVANKLGIHRRDVYFIINFIFIIQPREVIRKQMDFCRFPYIGKFMKQGVKKKDTNKTYKITDDNTIFSSRRTRSTIKP